MFAFSRNVCRARHRAPLALMLVFVSFQIAWSPLFAQSVPSADVDSTAAPSLDLLVALARLASPVVRAAEARVAAARARVGPAGARPDPMLMAGIVNYAIGAQPRAAPPEHGGAASNGLPDAMTMNMIGVSQTIIYPGKLGLQRAAATHDVAAADAALDAARLRTVRDVQDAWYELVYIDRALEVAQHTSAVMADLISATAARYSATATGSASQQDVLDARIQATRVAETATMLREQRRATLAQLNAAVGRPSDAPVAVPFVPDRIKRAAVGADSASVQFTAQTLGAPAAGSPLPSIADLQRLAIAQSPVVRQDRARIAAQSARVSVARRAAKPDIDVSLQYGQRMGWPDMVTAEVSVPLHVHRAQRENQEIAAANADLVALKADEEADENALRAQIATFASDLERQRTDLALYAKAILPQSRGAATAALAGYETGQSSLRAVLDAEASIYTYEAAYERSLTDFARTLAQLEQVVGVEVIP